MSRDDFARYKRGIQICAIPALLVVVLMGVHLASLRASPVIPLDTSKISEQLATEAAEQIARRCAEPDAPSWCESAVTDSEARAIDADAPAVP